MIEKGADWGRPGSLDESAPLFGSDHAVACHAVTGEGACGVTGGDLARTLGTRPGRDPRRAEWLVPVDIVAVDIGAERYHAAAHVMIGHRFSRSSIAIMNAAFDGRLNVAPRAHPGDGKLDVVEFDLGPIDRVKAWRRMPLGAHVPHPDIRVSRTSGRAFEFDRPRVVRVDGVAVGRASRVEVGVLIDRVEVAV